jgi:hypothetical protein
MGVPTSAAPVGVFCSELYELATRSLSLLTEPARVCPAAFAAPLMSALVSSSSSAGRRSLIAL